MPTIGPCTLIPERWPSPTWAYGGYNEPKYIKMVPHM
jgi:hypothetical protein